MSQFEDETRRLLRGYEGDEPYPEDDHSLGEHEGDPDPACKECRRAAKRAKEERS